MGVKRASGVRLQENSPAARLPDEIDYYLRGMASQQNPLIEFKPGIYGLKLNVLELIRRIIERKSSNPAEIVAQRFLQIFQDHGVAPTQILRVIPKLRSRNYRITLHF